MLHPVAVLTLMLGAAAADDAPRPPHIVFVPADDLGPGDLGSFGGTGAPTPNIDRLAAEGTRFRRFYVAAPICSPSRAALITGRFPARMRITRFLQERKGNRACGQDDFLDPAAPSLPRILKAAGYATCHVGKWHLGGGRDVTDAPKFAAYGYDEGLGTYESPEPHPDITAGGRIWSPKDKVKRWDPRETADLKEREPATARRLTDAVLAWKKSLPQSPAPPSPSTEKK
jgi:arylsulfatase A-like enzyme